MAVVPLITPLIWPLILVNAPMAIINSANRTEIAPKDAVNLLLSIVAIIRIDPAKIAMALAIFSNASAFNWL